MQLPTRSSLRPQVADRLTRLNRWYQKPIAQVSTALLLTVVSITFFAAVAIRPTLITITQLIRKIEDQRLVKAQLDQKVAALATAESEYSLIRPELTNIYQAIPTTTELDVILKQTEASAYSVPVTISDFSFTQVAIGPKLNEDAEITTNTTTAIPFTVGLSADFDSLTQYLTVLSTNKRLFALESINFTPNSQDNPSLINLVLNINAYYYPKPIE